MSEILTLKLAWSAAGIDRTATFYEGETYYIGRDKGCEIMFDDERISRRQIEIREEAGFFYIKNIGRGGPIVALNQTMGSNQRARLAKHAEVKVAHDYRVKVLDILRTDALKLVICPKCTRRVDQALKDCRWCGQNLAGAPTLYV